MSVSMPFLAFFILFYWKLSVKNDEKMNTGEVFSGSSSASRDISTVKNYGDIQLVVHTLPFLS